MARKEKPWPLGNDQGLLAGWVRGWGLRGTPSGPSRVNAVAGRSVPTKTNPAAPAALAGFIGPLLARQFEGPRDQCAVSASVPS
jgi:hypothetical protein